MEVAQAVVVVVVVVAVVFATPTEEAPEVEVLTLL
jgi:hypothetical protein